MLFRSIQVRYRELTDTTIERYLEQEPALDCAGSAKSEGLGIALVESIQSDDPTALIGLPLIETARLLREAGLRVPEVLNWEQEHGFLLLSDLGTHTMMQSMDPQGPPPLALYRDAVDALIAWQMATRPGVLPDYNEALLRRELQLFPDWYITRHKGQAQIGRAHV